MYSKKTTDSFERKFMLFLERCDQADIPECNRHHAFSIMLIGHARHYYSDVPEKQVYLPVRGIILPENYGVR